MATSQVTLILREVEQSKPISTKTRAFQHRRLQNRFHRFILKTFREQQKGGLTQKELAERIDSRPEQVNRWLSIPSNLTLNTICDLLLGMGVDMDDPSATPLADLAREAEQPVAALETRQAMKALYLGVQLKHFAFSFPEHDILVPQHTTQANKVTQPVAVPYSNFAELEPTVQGATLGFDALLKNSMLY